MGKQPRPVEGAVPRIRPTEPAVHRIDPDQVADALSAARPGQSGPAQSGPITLFALRSELLRRRQSPDGRPGIEGTSLRAKIPLNEQDWARLEDLAGALSTEGFSPSAGQVASVLLSLALRSVANEPREHVAARLAQELAEARSAGKP